MARHVRASCGCSLATSTSANGRLVVPSAAVALDEATVVAPRGVAPGAMTHAHHRGRWSSGGVAHPDATIMARWCRARGFCRRS
jgi:hypothetical protein